jgi:hypothetical protein
VGLLTHYSNRSDLLHELEVATERLQQAQQDGTPPMRSVRSPDRKGRAWSLAERLSEAQVQAIVAGFDAGTLRCQLAEHYKISVSSVARLLRRHRDSAGDSRGSA